MTIIKSFTDLEQSKKLADILPLESADMIWANDNDVIVVPYDMATRENVLHDFIPCWSLAALLDVLQEYHLSSPNPLCNTYCCRVKDIETYANNQVDSCYELILKLNELNFL